jgi:hypothetical protein
MLLGGAIAVAGAHGGRRAGDWKAIAISAALSAAFIATIAQQGSFSFARSVADHATNSHQHILSVSPVADRVVPDDARETEPWGPVRTTD